MKGLSGNTYNIALINSNKLDQLVNNVALCEVFDKARIETFENASDAMDFSSKKNFIPTS